MLAARSDISQCVAVPRNHGSELTHFQGLIRKPTRSKINKAGIGCDKYMLVFSSAVGKLLASLQGNKSDQ